MIPVLIWNLIYTGALPKAFQPATFQNDIPGYISIPENVLRLLVFMLALLMRIRFAKPLQRSAALLYFLGILLYFASWKLLMDSPQGLWARSLIGFMAPSFTPVIWLFGIGLMTDSSYFNLPLKKWHFLVTVILFLFFHNYHVWMIYSRIMN
ncbi:MAG: hypothetical protein GC181_05965 [Bacteroidetes bacterium]|nr:hypothetical protein [Bacteroidota bacterium]